jgi:hypothetical protein
MRNRLADFSLPLIALAVAVGLVIAWIDTRPGWDDTGVTAGLLLAASAIFAALRPRAPWLWAIAVGVWIPLVGILGTHNYGSLLALAIAFLGAYGGAMVRKTLALFK